MVYLHNRELVKWAVLGTFLSSFVFIDILVEMEGTEFGLWKFQIMPQLVSFASLIYLWGSNNRKIVRLAPILFILVGGLGVATGARSTGLAPFLAGLLTIVLQTSKHIKVNQIKNYLLAILLIGYGFFALVYVPNVLNGRISAGNSEQLKNLDNPYNPLNLLILGRGTSIVPFIAFIDRPITGWGYLASDPKGHYTMLARNLMDSEEMSASSSIIRGTIPRHSGWGDLACSYGIVGFLFVFLILRRSLV